MTFKKYNSIDNHYQTKQIMRWLNRYPELANETFVLEEKIDGANIQLYAEPGQEVKVGKRSSFISRDESFYQIWDVMERNSELVEFLNHYANSTGKSVRVYGELFGPGVQKRINYGVDKQEFIFFDVMIDEQLLTPYEAWKFTFNGSRPLCRFVPTYDIVYTLDDALKFKVDSLKSNFSDDETEGVVIKPYRKNYFDAVGSRFILKSKSDKFNEKMKVTPKEKKEIAPRVLEAYNTFAGYLTENRIDNVIGNHGPFEETKQIGDYIKYVMEDMKKDFLADGFNENEFDKDDLKQIYNVGHKIVLMLKGRL